MNLGDEAILQAMAFDLDHFTKRSNSYVPTRNVGLIRYIHRVKALGFSPIRLFLLLFRVKAVIIGGGSIFSNFAGIYVYFLPAYLLLAKLMRRKVLFYSIGYDGGTPLLLKSPSLLAISLANFVSVRDQGSLKNLGLIGRIKQAKLITDPVLHFYDLVPKASVKAARAKADEIVKAYRSDDEKLVGIAALPLKEAEFNKKFTKRFPKNVDLLMKAHPGIRFIVFNFYQGTDTAFNTNWIRNVSRQYQSRIYNETKWIDPLTMMELIKQLDQFIAVRLHAKVFAQVRGARYIPICYADKCYSFLKGINKKGYPYSKLLERDFLGKKLSNV
jgi:polysaccharide pyruvyl transferase WcaK-like protein